jgi:hypothetical protein
MAAVVDLRSREERDKSPSAWRTWPVDVYESPKPSLAPVMRMLLANAATAGGTRTSMQTFYGQMPDIYKEEYAALFHRIAAGETAILVTVRRARTEPASLSPCSSRRGACRARL